MLPLRSIFLLLLALLVAGCGEAPSVVQLTADDRAVWSEPRASDAIPVLLYHGIAGRDEFAVAADAHYAVRPEDFAKQLALLDNAGYEAVTLEQFRAFHAREDVALPEHPVLITFDDGRADAWDHADPVLERHGWSAVMFVDVGAVGSEEYSNWDELAAMQASGRWSIQLHAGRGHHSIRYGDEPREVGPFYAYRASDETLGEWQERVIADLDWGEQQLRRHVPGYEPLAFAPPFGAYGQLDTNDPAIPNLLGRELRERYGIVFVQQDPHHARPGERDVTRLQLDRTMTGGALHDWLARP